MTTRARLTTRVAIVVFGTVCVIAYLSAVDARRPPTSTTPTQSLRTKDFSASEKLARLRIAPEDTSPYDPAVWGEDRPLPCPVRGAVLRDYGTEDVLDNGCSPYCPPGMTCWTGNYDNRFVNDPDELVLDHLVSPWEAHRSGAVGWAAGKRVEFREDLDDLVPTSQEFHDQHAGRDAANWQPPSAWQCLFARDYIDVKTEWELTVDQAEHDALAAMLTTCKF